MVIDANLAVWAVIPLVAPVDPLPLVRGWLEQGLSIEAPAHWLSECTSALRRYAFRRLITLEQANVALEDLFGLPVELVPVDQNLCLAALAWAERLRQSRAYDGFYVALAERLGTELWTGDRGLAAGAAQAGASWVRGVAM